MLFAPFFTLSLAALLSLASGQTQTDPVSDSYTCSSTKPCKIGCCSNTGICGMGPTFCGAGNCTSSCDAKSECDAGWGAQWSSAETCPLNVCCSKFGFCGTTPDFCGSSTVTRPSCPGGTSSNQRVMAYYEGWSTTRACQGMFPEDIPYTAYTHLNYAFALIDPQTFAVAPMSPDDPDLMQRLTGLKQLNPGLQVWLSIGGWSMNDPDQPTAATFSTLAGSTSAQSAFFASVVQVLQNYGFDGVDIDWEYPVAPERSGAPADRENYVSFLTNLRSALGATGHTYGLTITLPSSYWYLQNFDIVSIEPVVDWFNVMTYDLHGTWDSSDPYIGPFVYAHTNLTEISQTMDLLWRNNISPSKVTMGLGFYGRSFTLSDPSCTAPGCSFNAGGDPGPCTASAGTLSYAEIQDILNSGKATVTLDPQAAVQIAVWNSNQWVSFDDEQTLKMKVDFANSLCLGGVMVWAGSLDDANGDAAAALSAANGRAALNAVALSSLQNSLTQCVWGGCGSGGAACPPGTSPAQRSDGGGKGNTGIYTGCPKGQQRNFCCPSSNMPTCQWRGTAPICAHAACLTGEVAVASDRCGTGKCCSFNHKNLCCTQTDTDFAFSQCQWSGSAPVCNILFGNLGQASCPSGLTALTEDKDGAGGEQACGPSEGYKTFCCPSPAPFSNCAWYNNSQTYSYWPQLTSVFSFGGSQPISSTCSGGCPNGQTPIAADSTACKGGTTAYFCCDNPTALSNPIPVADTELCDLPDGLIDDSATPEPEDANDALTELELFEQEDDCYVGGVTDSGDSSEPFYRNEFRRRAESGEATQEDVEELLTNLWAEQTGELVKRGAARSSKLCKNKPGKSRSTTQALLKSTPYRNVAWLIANAGKKVYYADKRACAQKVLNVGTNLVSGYKFVAEHVWEQQGAKSFLQAMIDGVKPGNSALSTGILPWTPFDQQNAATAYFYQTWTSLGVTFSGAGTTPMQSLYSVFGTLTDSNNLLVLDSQTNGMKAILWQGGKDPVASTVWSNANNLERLGLLNRMKTAFDYMNSADSQTAFQYVYSNTLTVCAAFEQALSAANIAYDVQGAFREWSAAQFGWMGTNAQNWLGGSTANLAAEKAFWASNAAIAKYSASAAKANLLSIQQLIASIPQWATVTAPR